MKALTALLGLLVACVLAVGLQAEEEKKGKEVTLKGKLTCGKCTLAETDACSNVLVVKEGDKSINYYLKDKGRGAPYHKAICPPNTMKDAAVTGTVAEEDGKKVIINPKVKFAE
jgi:hypothetical protein